MSPAVIRRRGAFLMLYRRVLERSGDPAVDSEYEDHSVLALAVSHDGERFNARPQAVLEPGGEHALIGVEDPTVVEQAGECFVFYTGWSGWAPGVATLLWARGPSVEAVTPQGVAARPSPPERFVKEAELRAGAAGWMMWREVATFDRHEHSRIALARGPGPAGPWSAHAIVASPRPNRWDAVNLSTGPLLTDGDRLYMLYNGMVSTPDPEFVHAARVGLLELDCGTGRVLARSRAPVLDPPSGRRIVFAASLVADRLYVTVDDGEIWSARLARGGLAGVPMDPEERT